MAHSRDFRRKEYWAAVRSVLGPDFALAESGLDEVAYNPRLLVCTPPPREPDSELDSQLDSRVDPRLLEEVAQRLSTESLGPVEPPKNPVEWQSQERWVFEVPEQGGPETLHLATELNDQFPQQVTPSCYAVTQQHIQPGEDPEEGRPVPGIPSGPVSAAGTGQLGEGVTIAVIDTGIDRDAVRVAGMENQLFDDPDDVDPLIDPTAGPLGFLGPGGGHGTFIASLIHAVAPGTTVRSYRVTDPLGVVREQAIADGIHRAIADGADVINLSIGGYPFSKNPAWPTLPAFPLVEAAVAAVSDKVAVVAAAGNCGSADPFYPAAFPGVIGVAALEADNRLWKNSNYGDWVVACARGVDLLGLFVRGAENPAYDPDQWSEAWEEDVNYASWSGTSFAAPLVAAQIAVFAAGMGLVGDTRNAANLLLQTSRPHPDPRGCGRRILVDVPGQT